MHQEEFFFPLRLKNSSGRKTKNVKKFLLSAFCSFRAGGDVLMFRPSGAGRKRGVGKMNFHPALVGLIKIIFGSGRLAKKRKPRSPFRNL